MKKYVVVSTTNNPDYYFYLPYIQKAWAKYGWGLVVIITQDLELSSLTYKDENIIFIRIPDMPNVRRETIAQAGRLYAANYFKHDEHDVLLMTSDMDLLPLKDYWKPDPNNITVYGHDLTWYSFYPMGYCAMTVANWKKHLELFGDTDAEFFRDAKITNLPFAPDWESWWNHDWQLLTQRLTPYKQNITFINRGQIDIAGATLAKGRVDRYNWRATMNQPDWIDAHCHNNNVLHPDKQNDFFDVYNKIYGEL